LLKPTTDVFDSCIPSIPSPPPPGACSVSETLMALHKDKQVRNLCCIIYFPLGFDISKVSDEKFSSRDEISQLVNSIPKFNI